MSLILKPRRLASWAAQLALGGLMILGFDLAASQSSHSEKSLFASAEARFARGGAARGGYRATARTSFSAGARYGRATTLPAYGAGRTTPQGTARRTARRTTRRVSSRHDYASSYGGYSGYSYGSPVYVLPGGCVSVILDGQPAYQCDGAYYVSRTVNGQIVYYSIQ